MARDDAGGRAATERWRAPAGFWMAMLLGGMGCVVIYGSSLGMERPGYFALRQGAWLVAGLALYVICSQIPARRWERATPWLTGLAWLLMIAVLIVGHSHNGMRGWFMLNVPFGGPYFKVIQIQPSELAKPVFVLFVAWLVSRYPAEASPSLADYGRIVLGVGMWLLLLGLQPDFGTALIYALTFGVMYWLRGGRPWHLALTALAALPVGMFVYWRFPYVQRRLIGFLDPEGHASGAGYHYLQNQAALASGGWIGRPADDPMVTGSYLPHAHSDSVFASMGEQVGLIGTLGLLLCLGLWLAWISSQGLRQASLRRSLVVAGAGAIIGVQALVHISVTLGVLPPTGVTLPLLSYGGSSLVGTLAALGIVVSMQRAAPRGQAIALGEGAAADPESDGAEASDSGE